jgi:diguanylate cyclase (GGDEF)-like protein
LPRTARFWIGSVATLTVAQIIVSVLLPAGLALTTVSDSLSIVLLVVLLVAFAQNAIPTRGRLRAFWIMQAVGWFISLVSQGWWMFFDVVLRKPVPMLFVGDVLLFLPGILMLAGLLLRPHVHESDQSARLGMLDFLLLMLWWVCFYVYLVMCWQYVSPNEGLYNQNYDRLYMVENLILTIVLCSLLRQSTGAWRRFYLLFLGAVLFNYVCFAVENRAVELNTYFSGSWYDSPQMASFALFMVIAMKGRGLSQTPATTEDARYGSWMGALAILAVLSLPVIVLIAVLESGVSSEIVHFRVLVSAGAMFAMAGLVFMKQQLLHKELKLANHVLEESSMTDPLTRIHNRRFFSATILADVAQSLRAYAEGDDQSTRDLVFYLIDLDDFKDVNDLHGHDAGDRVLIDTSRRISSAIRNSDVLVRWGGEEFLIVSRYTDRGQAAILAKRVIEAVSGKPFVVGTVKGLRQTCSIGWAAFPWLEENVEAMGYEEVLKYADRALYRAKKAGKNQAIGMTPSGIVETNPNPLPNANLPTVTPQESVARWPVMTISN